MNTSEILQQAAQRYGHKPALIYKEQSVTFLQLQEKVLRLANGLKKEGVGKGDKVAFFLPNCPEYVYSYLAVFYLGAVGVPLDYMLKEDELLSCLEHSETKVLIARPNQDVDLIKIKGSVPSLKKIIGVGEALDGGRSVGEFLQNEEARLFEVPVQETDPALIMYTSGTTGKPKGILQIGRAHV